MLRNRWLLAWVVVTTLVAAATPFLLVEPSIPADRLLAVVAVPTQSLVSVLVPLSGVGLARRRSSSTAGAARRTLVLAVVVAAMVTVVTFGFCCLAVLTRAAGAGERWHDAPLLLVGAVLVQVLAQLVGTGCGWLIRSRVLACLATIVLPLGLWWLLGVFAALAPLRPWLTPYAHVDTLLSGRLGRLDWPAWLLVVALWGLGLNLLGLSRARTRAAV